MGSFVSHGNVNRELHFKHTTNLLAAALACGSCCRCRVSQGRGSQRCGVTGTLCAEQQLGPGSLLWWGDENLGVFFVLAWYLIFALQRWRWIDGEFEDGGHYLMLLHLYITGFSLMSYLLLLFKKYRVWKLEDLFSVDFYLFWLCGRMRKYHGYNQ